MYCNVSKPFKCADYFQTGINLRRLKTHYENNTNSSPAGVELSHIVFSKKLNYCIIFFLFRETVQANPYVGKDFTLTLLTTLYQKVEIPCEEQNFPGC